MKTANTSQKKKGCGTRDEILNCAHKIMGMKGFSAVGLNEILKEAGVPKGSFYHWFESKDDFGQALLSRYFEQYLAEIDDNIISKNISGADQILFYFDRWLHSKGCCLVVKLAAEVSDLSESMRGVLADGTNELIKRLTTMANKGIKDGSITSSHNAKEIAEQLYQTWLGASLMSKIRRSDTPLKTAMITTKDIFKS